MSAHFSIALVSVIGPWWFHWSLCLSQSFTVYHPLCVSPASYDHHLCIVVLVFSSRATDCDQNCHKCNHFKLKFHTLALALVRRVHVVLVPLWHMYSVNQSGWIHRSLPALSSTVLSSVLCVCGEWWWKAHRVKDPLRLSEDEARCRRLFYETKWERRRALSPAQLFGLRVMLRVSMMRNQHKHSELHNPMSHSGSPLLRHLCTNAVGLNKLQPVWPVHCRQLKMCNQVITG